MLPSSVALDILVIIKSLRTATTKCMFGILYFLSSLKFAANIILNEMLSTVPDVVKNDVHYIRNFFF